MSKTHKELVEVGYRWLLRAKTRNAIACYGACGVAFKEVVSLSNEQPDVIGFRSNCSILIECKANRADFLSDSKKPFRLSPDTGIGEYRFYLTNPEIIKVEELPEKWGPLVCDRNCIKILKDAQKHSDYSWFMERALLYTILNRMKHFDLLDAVNDARYNVAPYEYDMDLKPYEPHRFI